MSDAVAATAAGVSAPVILGATALSSFGDLLGQSLSYQSQKSMYSKQLKDNWLLNRLAIEDERAYNHPTAQMQRLKEAGLNPNLIYGNGVGALTSSAQGVSPPTIKPSYAGDVKLDFLTALESVQRLQNMSSQNKIADANARIAQHDADLLTGLPLPSSAVKGAYSSSPGTMTLLNWLAGAFRNWGQRRFNIPDEGPVIRIDPQVPFLY